MSDALKTVYLADYQPYTHLLDQVDLLFQLAPQGTRVVSKLAFRPNPARPGRHDLRLDGEGLRLISVQCNGQHLAVGADASGLTVAKDLLPDGPFTLEISVECDPAANTALEGLYMSNGMYCTQCEAEGFRRITYYPDRPDVMARFQVRIEADLPVLLSNGNPLASGPGWAQWDDPWPKPAYLFALVAGDLTAHRDTFTTMSGREVDLGVYVRPDDGARCAFAMASLIRSMLWDEAVYGREYDLDVFNIVAVDDFNMGAMENKGLNIFNSKYVLASPDTATDEDYARIEAIIAHEYFHNWTGNRITCRDWFQLCLKEGLTVFRDQSFTADLRGAAVKRIEDALLLRARQFREDQGPLAHPVRPESFVEINNFYTATIYEKGAEVIGMLKRLVGDAAYAKAVALYFDRHDGSAATIEDWLAVFEEVTGRDLRQFKCWYSEAGTPRLHVEEAWSEGVFTLTLRQELRPTPGQAEKSAKVIPVAVGLLGQDGGALVPTTMLEMTELVQSFRFEGLAARPIASVLRGFSAPVELIHPRSPAQNAFLLAHDSDPYNRFEAGRQLALDMLAGMARHGGAADPDWAAALAGLVNDAGLDPAFRALALRLPSDEEIAKALAAAGEVPDPAAIYLARERARAALAKALEPQLPGLIAAMQTAGPYSADAIPAGKRALKLEALALQARLDGGAAAAALFAARPSMTEEIGSLSILLSIGQGAAALRDFEARWQDDRLVMDKWFSLQISRATPEQVVPLVEALTARADFDWKNPNRFRAVFGALAAHHAGFHAKDGSGYRLLAQWLIRLDPLNPQGAARMSSAFETWPRYDAGRQAQIRASLAAILATPGLSRDLAEMASRMAAH